MAADINNRGKLVTLPPIAPTMHRATGLFTFLTSLGFGAIEFEIRSGYLLLANHHTSSEGHDSRDLCKTQVKSQYNNSQIFDPTSNIQPFKKSTYFDYLRISFNANAKLVVRKTNV